MTHAMPHTITISDIEPSRKKLVISAIDKKTLEKAEKRTIDELGKQLKLKGFRPGKIPESVIREEIDPGHIRVRTLEFALPMVLQEIADGKKHRLIGRPDVRFSALEPLKIEVEYDIYPEIKIGNYKKIKTPLKKKTGTEKEVEDAIENLKRRFSEYKAIDQAAKKSDRIEIDFQGSTPDGVPLDQVKSSHYPVIIGSGILIPGFEDHLIGMKKNEKKSFDLTFPKDYHVKSLAGKKVKFSVNVHEVEETILPEITEAWLEKTFGKKMTLPEWKEEIKKQIQEAHDQESKREQEATFLKELLTLISAEMPTTLLTMEQASMLQEMKAQVERSGLSYDHYLKAMKKTEEELRKSFEKPAEERLKLRFGLQEIAKQEGVDFSKVLEKLLEKV